MAAKLMALVAAVAFAILWLPQQAAAHVLVRDQSGQTGLILHIVPDDDPVAGRPAYMFFDVQQLQDTGASATLTIRHESSQVTVPLTTRSSGFNAAYTFPRQGAYTLRLSVQAGDRTVVFVHDQRVSRGVQPSHSAGVSHVWAEMGLMVTGVLLAAVAIVAWNRRRDIVRASKL